MTHGGAAPNLTDLVGGGGGKGLFTSGRPFYHISLHSPSRKPQRFVESPGGGDVPESKSHRRSDHQSTVRCNLVSERKTCFPYP